MPEIIEMISELVSKGFAYEINGTVYYDITKFPEYGHPKPSNAVSCASLPFIDFIMNFKLHRMIQQCHFEAYC
jgi:hypothetical protein